MALGQGAPWAELASPLSPMGIGPWLGTAGAGRLSPVSERAGTRSHLLTFSPQDPHSGEKHL